MRLNDNYRGDFTCGDLTCGDLMNNYRNMLDQIPKMAADL